MTTQILVIEDLPANLKLVTVILEAFGYKVLAAEDGYAGLKTAREVCPDLVLCDLLMDGLDGFGVAREIRGDAVLKKVPLVAVTALVTDGVEQKVLDSGFDGYISKPIEARKFVPQLEKYLPEDLRVSPSPH